MARLLEYPVIDWTDCPFVEINPRKLSGTPVLKHSRMPAYAIVEIYVAEIADDFEIPEAGVRNLLLWAAERNPAIKL